MRRRDVARIVEARKPQYAWPTGGGMLVAVLTVELSAVLNLERSVTFSAHVAGFGAMGDIRSRVLLLILYLGELYAQLDSEASYAGAES